MSENKEITETWYPIPPYAVELFAVGFGFWRGHVRRLSTDTVLASIPNPGARGLEAAKQWAKRTVERLENRCPICGETLIEVRQSEPKMLNSEQFDSVKAGDYYCSKDRVYWWSRPEGMVRSTHTSRKDLEENANEPLR